MSTGKLFVVATPIGNMDDIVPRAVHCLQSVDLIAAEDTRKSGILCRHFNINTPLTPVHEHNERQRVDELIGRLNNGLHIALISDAGMPLVSDPGYRLVKAAREAKITVTVIPGACALITALAGAGLASDRFTFLGFVPNKEQTRINFYEEAAQANSTHIFYESSHRILASLKNLKSALEKTHAIERKVCIARELTKTFETWHWGNITELITAVESNVNQRKGEFVIVLEGCSDIKNNDKATISKYMSLLMQDLPIKKAAQITAELLNSNKKLCYSLGLASKEST